ncbi:hypothetical protein HDV05_007359, partial [Chytridiales sp. JEL 0842]
MKTNITATIATILFTSVLGSAWAQHVPPASMKSYTIETFSSLSTKVKDMMKGVNFETSAAVIFSPTDAAFEEYGADFAAKLQNDTALAKSFLSYHIVIEPLSPTFPNSTSNSGGSTPGKYTEFLDTMLMEDSEPQQIRVDADIMNDKGEVKLSVYGGYNRQAKVVDTIFDNTDNITIFVIDRVLNPPQKPSTLLNAAGLNFLSKLSDPKPMYNKIDSLRNITLLVPTPESIDKFFNWAKSQHLNVTDAVWSQIIALHTVAGLHPTSIPISSEVYNSYVPNQPLSIATSDANELAFQAEPQTSTKTTFSNLILNNGLAHVVDTVLYPPVENWDLDFTVEKMKQVPFGREQDIVLEVGILLMAKF